MEKIQEMLETIKNNLFINDVSYEARAIQNKELAHRVREIIARGGIDRRIQVETLDFLEGHNL